MIILYSTTADTVNILTNIVLPPKLSGFLLKKFKNRKNENSAGVRLKIHLAEGFAISKKTDRLNFQSVCCLLRLFFAAFLWQPDLP